MFTMFSHVGLLVRDIEAAIEHWTNAFGLKLLDRGAFEVEGIHNAILSTGGEWGRSTCIELISPIDPEDTSHAIAKRLADTGEGVFHLAFHAESPHDAMEELSAKGLRVQELPRVREGQPSRAVIHPKSANGVLIELIAPDSPSS